MPNPSPRIPGGQPNEKDDAMLAIAARRDPSAFGALYRRYVTPVYRYLYSRAGNTADAEDLTSKVFTEALEGLGRYREQGSFAAWLFAIAHHKVADYYRRQRPQLPLNEDLDGLSGDESPLAHVVQEETLQRLASLVAQLDEDRQELLRLRFAAGLTYGQVAAVVGRSEGSVKMSMHRLLRRLEAEWEESDEQAN